MKSPQTDLFQENKGDNFVNIGKAKRKNNLFGKAMLKEAIRLLPTIPETNDLLIARHAIRANLRTSAKETRRRHSDYIVYRMFPDGTPDFPMRHFAKLYEGRQELRDVAFYRFIMVETLMPQIIQTLVLPYIGAGVIERHSIREYLAGKYPEAKSIKDCVQAIAEALVASGVARSEKHRLLFSYREIALASFAFILYSECGQPGMYDIAKVENNPMIQSMLWRPDRLVPSLYELRNRGVISKISEIDMFRQFTITMTLRELVEALEDKKILV